MRCIVTAGPTWEALDQVRRLTNRSTGRLGVELANYLAAAGHEVTLLLGEQSTWRGERRARKCESFSSGGDLALRLQGRREKGVDAVFHAAAVGDFRFGKVWSQSQDGSLVPKDSRKFSTRYGSLLVELIPTEKIIVRLRDWFPGTRLAGWKYEVDGNRDTALAAARAQIRENRTDACVANGPAYGEGFGWVTGAGEQEHLEGREQLYTALEKWMRG